MSKRMLPVVGLAIAAIACSGRTLIGTVTDGPPPNGNDDGGPGLVDGGDDGVAHSGGTCAPPRDPNDRAFTFPAGVAGTWTGTYQPPVGAVRDVPIKLILDQAADGSDQIHVVFGTNPPPAPATSATQDYLPDWVPQKIYDGFPYLAHQVSWNGLEVRFVLAYTEPWDSWCRMQQSYDQAPGVPGLYLCIPNVAWMGDGNDVCTSTTSPRIVLPCHQVEACAAYNCQCDVCGCAGSAVGSNQIITATFAGDTATITGGHLTRVTN